MTEHQLLHDEIAEADARTAERRIQLIEYRALDRERARQRAKVREYLDRCAICHDDNCDC